MLNVEAELRRRNGEPSPDSGKWDILEKATDRIATAQDWVRAELAEEAWNGISLEQMGELRTEWQINTLATTITEKLLGDNKLRSNTESLRLNHITNLMVASMDLQDVNLRWAVPASVSRLESTPASVLAGPAASLAKTSTPPAARSNKIVLLARYPSVLEENNPQIKLLAETTPARIAV